MLKLEINSKLSVQAQENGCVNVIMTEGESTATLQLEDARVSRLFAMALLTAAEEAEALLKGAE